MLDEVELEDIKQDLEAMRATFPAEAGSKLTRDGRLALGAGSRALNLLWSKPLGDPQRSDLANGRHQSQAVRTGGDG